MPISYVLDRPQRRVRTVVTGSISIDDIVSYVEIARREQSIPFSELIDVRGVTPPWMSSADIWRAANTVRTFKNDEEFGPRAIVVANALIFGSVRMFANLIQDFSAINVFYDTMEAEAWLTKSSALAE